MVDDTGAPPGDVQQARRSELIARTVHDLKNPLAVVRATLEWLDVELSDREDALDAVRDAATAAARLMVIVEDLDTLARIEAGSSVVGRDPVEISAIAGAVAASAGARLASRRVSVASLAPGAVETSGDEPLLTRAIEALVTACARGAQAGACVEIEVRVVEPASESAGGGAIEISVGIRGAVATGPAVSSTESLASGGLGVYLALEVVEGHGGSLSVVPTDTVPRVVVSLPR